MTVTMPDLQFAITAPETLPYVLHTRVVTGTGGGPEKTILNSPRFLNKSGYRSDCLYLHPPDDPGFAALQQKAAAWGCEIISVPDQGLFDFSVIRRLIRICKEREVAIWHAHDYKSNALGLLLRPFHKMHLVTTVHGWVHHTSKTPLYYWVDRQSIRRYERVICVSEDLHQTCLEFGVSQKRCRLIQNAIDTEEFRRTQTVLSAKTKLGLDTNRLLIGAVGRLAEEKGFHLLIQAVERLIDQGVPAELIMIGEGGEHANLKAQIAASPHSQSLRLLGYRSDTIQLYEAMDLFVLSSLREGLPNVLLEAMALEVPVVSTRIAGVPKLITDRQHGLLVEPGNVEELQQSMLEIAENCVLRDSLVQAARQKIEREFSFAARMEKIRDVYDELLDCEG